MSTTVLSPEQRDTALSKAREARRAQQRLLGSVKAGHVSAVHLLTTDDPSVARIRVSRLIRAVPGYGTVKADRLLRAAGVHPKRRVGGLGARQRAKLVETLSR